MQPPDRKDKLELYKLVVEMADRVSARRGTANTFYLSVSTGLTTVLAVLKPLPGSQQLLGLNDPWTTLFGGLVGFVLCFVWYFTLRSYRHLNSAKYDVILKLEQDLHAQPFGDEWDKLKNVIPTNANLGRWRKYWINIRDQYTELTNVESAVPVVFGLIYLALMVRAFWV